MADPINDLKTLPKATSRAKQWGRKGIPKDPNRAHERIRNSRKSRPKPKPKAPLSGTFREGLVWAIESMSDRFDVSRTEVMAKAFELLVLEYGNDDELLSADIKENPFSRIPKPAARVMPEPDYSMFESGPEINPAPMYPTERGVSPSMAAAMGLRTGPAHMAVPPGIFAPLPEIHKEIEDDQLELFSE